MGLSFDQYAQEANAFMNELSGQLGHPESKEQTAIILRSVLHVLRDRISISESLDVLAQLPMFLKAIYVDQWKFRERPKKWSSINEFKEEIKEEQSKFGETDFDWPESTDKIAQMVFNSLRKYLTEGQVAHIEDNMPLELKPLFSNEPIEK